jgi:hypothetical protein
MLPVREVSRHFHGARFATKLRIDLTNHVNNFANCPFASFPLRPPPA